MRRTAASLIAAALVAGVLAGCSDEPDSTGSDTPSTASPSSSDTPSPTPSATSTEPTPTPTPTPSTTTPGPTGPTQASASPSPSFPRSQLQAASIHLAYLASSSAETPEERAVVDAWMAYWQAAADVYYNAKVTDAFERTARGEARDSIVTNMQQYQQQGQRVVGWAKDNVVSVRVTGDRATLRDCTENYTFNVDGDGEPVSKPIPWYDVTGRLEKQGGRWVVVTENSVQLEESCL